MNPETILKATAAHYGIPEAKLKQRRRGPWKISWPRLLAMSLAYEDNTGMTGSRICRQASRGLMREGCGIGRGTGGA